MVKDQCAYARFWIHHHAFGELYPDGFGVQQLPEPGLIVQVRASRIAKAVALPAIPRYEPLGHRDWLFPNARARLRPRSPQIMPGDRVSHSAAAKRSRSGTENLRPSAS